MVIKSFMTSVTKQTRYASHTTKVHGYRKVNCWRLSSDQKLSLIRFIIEKFSVEDFRHRKKLLLIRFDTEKFIVGDFRQRKNYSWWVFLQKKLLLKTFVTEKITVDEISYRNVHCCRLFLRKCYRKVNRWRFSSEKQL